MEKQGVEAENDVSDRVFSSLYMSIAERRDSSANVQRREVQRKGHAHREYGKQ